MAAYQKWVILTWSHLFLGYSNKHKWYFIVTLEQLNVGHSCEVEKKTNLFGYQFLLIKFEKYGLHLYQPESIRIQNVSKEKFLNHVTYSLDLGL